MAHVLLLHRPYHLYCSGGKHPPGRRVSLVPSLPRSLAFSFLGESKRRSTLFVQTLLVVWGLSLLWLKWMPFGRHDSVVCSSSINIRPVAHITLFHHPPFLLLKINFYVLIAMNRAPRHMIRWQIVRQRIHLHVWKDGRVWNSFPGGLLTLANYSDVPAAYPWKHSPPPSWNQISNPSPKFTALIYTQQASGLTPGSGGGAPLLRLLRTVARSPHVAKVTDIFSFFVPPSLWQRVPPAVCCHGTHADMVARCWFCLCRLDSHLVGQRITQTSPAPLAVHHAGHSASHHHSQPPREHWPAIQVTSNLITSKCGRRLTRPETHHWDLPGPRIVTIHLVASGVSGQLTGRPQ